MFKINKLTDYATQVLAQLANQAEANLDSIMSAQDLAERTGLGHATVTKLLKSLSTAQLVTAERGAHGGYRLARTANDISAADVLQALEGPVALTECCSEETECALIDRCQVQSSWQTINQNFQLTLSAVSLNDLIGKQPALAKKLAQANLGAGS